MRLTRTLIRPSIVVGSLSAALVLGATGASGQLPIEPTVTPTVNTGGWVYGMAVLIAVIGFVVTLALIAGYLRFSRHFRQEQAASAPKVVRATPVYEGYEPAREPVLAAAPSEPASQAAAPAPPPAAPSPPASPAQAPAAATAPAPASAAPASPPASRASAPAVAPASAAQADAPASTAEAAAPAPAEHVEVELDQEVFEAKLAELLEKGTDRRVAEGQARRAAMIAARKKAAGG